MKFFRHRFTTMFAVVFLLAFPLLSVGGEVLEEETVKPLSAWDGIQLRIREDGKWRDLKFGVLEAHLHGLIHKGRETTIIPWKRMTRTTLHPLDNRIRMELASPDGVGVLDTLLNWSRYDFEMIYRDIERFRREAEEKLKEGKREKSEDKSRKDNHIEAGGE